MLADLLLNRDAEAEAAVRRQLRPAASGYVVRGLRKDTTGALQGEQELSAATAGEAKEVRQARSKASTHHDALLWQAVALLEQSRTARSRFLLGCARPDSSGCCF
jgi:hypothetical protein